MATLDRCISNVMGILADAAETLQPFSKEVRQLDEAVKILERIDGQAESGVAE